MSLAVLSIPLCVESRSPVPAAGFPLLARADGATPHPQRPRAEAPPAPPIFEEEDAERWDGMG